MTDEELVGRLRRSVTDTTAFCPSPVFRNPDGPEAATRIEQLHKEVERLRGGLIQARARFYEYADSHHAKGTPEGDEKAQRNIEMAEMCSAALLPIPSPSSSGDT